MPYLNLNNKSYLIPDGLSDEEAIALVRQKRPLDFPADTNKAEEGFFPSLMSGMRQYGEGAGYLGAMATGMGDEAIKKAQAIAARKEAETTKTTSMRDVEKAYGEEGALAGLGKFATLGKETIASSLPAMAGIAGGAYGGAALGALTSPVTGPVGPVVGGVAGALLGALPAQTQQMVSRQIEAHPEAPIERGTAMTGAVAASALDIAEQFATLGTLGVSAAVVKPVTALLRRGATETAEKVLLRKAEEALKTAAVAERGTAETVLRGAGRGLVAEVPIEVAQQVIERAQAGLPLLNDDAMQEYKDTAATMVIPGAAFGPLGALHARGEARAEVKQAAVDAAAKKRADDTKAEQDRQLTTGYLDEQRALRAQLHAEMLQYSDVAKDESTPADVRKQARAAAEQAAEAKKGITQQLIALGHEAEEEAPPEQMTLEQHMKRVAAKKEQERIDEEARQAKLAAEKKAQEDEDLRRLQETQQLEEQNKLLAQQGKPTIPVNKGLQSTLALPTQEEQLRAQVEQQRKDSINAVLKEQIRARIGDMQAPRAAQHYQQLVNQLPVETILRAKDAPARELKLAPELKTRIDSGDVTPEVQGLLGLRGLGDASYLLRDPGAYETLGPVIDARITELGHFTRNYAPEETLVMHGVLTKEGQQLAAAHAAIDQLNILKSIGENALANKEAPEVSFRPGALPLDTTNAPTAAAQRAPINATEAQAREIKARNDAAAAAEAQRKAAAKYTIPGKKAEPAAATAAAAPAEPVPPIAPFESKAPVVPEQPMQPHQARAAANQHLENRDDKLMAFAEHLEDLRQGSVTDAKSQQMQVDRLADLKNQIIEHTLEEARLRRKEMGLPPAAPHSVIWSRLSLDQRLSDLIERAPESQITRGAPRVRQGEAPVVPPMMANAIKKLEGIDRTPSQEALYNQLKRVANPPRIAEDNLDAVQQEREKVDQQIQQLKTVERSRAADRVVTTPTGKAVPVRSAAPRTQPVSREMRLLLQHQAILRTREDAIRHGMTKTPKQLPGVRVPGLTPEENRSFNRSYRAYLKGRPSASGVGVPASTKALYPGQKAHEFAPEPLSHAAPRTRLLDFSEVAELRHEIGKLSYDLTYPLKNFPGFMERSYEAEPPANMAEHRTRTANDIKQVLTSRQMSGDVAGLLQETQGVLEAGHGGSALLDEADNLVTRISTGRHAALPETQDDMRRLAEELAKEEQIAATRTKPRGARETAAQAEKRQVKEAAATPQRELFVPGEGEAILPSTADMERMQLAEMGTTPADFRRIVKEKNAAALSAISKAWDNMANRQLKLDMRALKQAQAFLKSLNRVYEKSANTLDTARFNDLYADWLKNRKVTEYDAFVGQKHLFLPPGEFRRLAGQLSAEQEYEAAKERTVTRDQAKAVIKNITDDLKRVRDTLLIPAKQAMAGATDMGAPRFTGATMLHNRALKTLAAVERELQRTEALRDATLEQKIVDAQRAAIEANKEEAAARERVKAGAPGRTQEREVMKGMRAGKINKKTGKQGRPEAYQYEDKETGQAATKMVYTEKPGAPTEEQRAAAEDVAKEARAVAREDAKKEGRVGKTLPELIAEREQLRLEHKFIAKDSPAAKESGAKIAELSRLINSQQKSVAALRARSDKKQRGVRGTVPVKRGSGSVADVELRQEEAGKTVQGITRRELEREAAGELPEQNPEYVAFVGAGQEDYAPPEEKRGMTEKERQLEAQRRRSAGLGAETEPVITPQEKAEKLKRAAEAAKLARQQGVKVQKVAPVMSEKEERAAGTAITPSEASKREKAKAFAALQKEGRVPPRTLYAESAGGRAVADDTVTNYDSVPEAIHGVYGLRIDKTEPLNGMTFAQAAAYGASKTQSRPMKFLFKALERALANVKSDATMNGSGRVYVREYVDTKPSSGLYNTKGDFALVEHSSSPRHVQMLLHELTHAATAYGLLTDPKLLTDVRKIMNQVDAWLMRPEGLRYLQNNGHLLWQKGKQQIYGLTDEHEFLAETYSNQAFQDLLARVPSVQKNESLLSKFVEAVLHFFRSMSGIPVHKSTLMDAMTVAERAMEATQAQAREGASEITMHSSAATYDPTFEGVADRIIAPMRAPVATRIRRFIAGFHQGVADYQAPVHELLGAAAKTGQLTEKEALQASYLLRERQDLHNYTLQSMSNGFVRLIKNPEGDHMYLGDGDASVVKIFDALRPAMKDVGSAEETKRQFQLYRLVERGELVGHDKFNYGEEAPTAAERAAILAHGRANPAFQAAGEIYDRYNRGLIDLNVATGRISKAEGKRLNDQKFFTPMYRENEAHDVEMVIDAGRRIKIGNLKSQPYLHELVGSDLRVKDLDTVLQQNTALLINSALSNMATRNAAFTLQKLGLALIGRGQFKGPNVVHFHIEPENAEDDGRRSAVIGDDAASQQTEKMRANMARVPVGSKVYEVLQNKLTALQARQGNFGDISGEMLVKSMEGLGAPMQAGLIMARDAANLLRKGVTRNPLYSLRQLIRDPMMAWMTTGANINPLTLSVKGVSQALSGGRAAGFKEAQQRGIIGGQVLNGNPADVAKITEQYVKNGNAGGFWQFLDKLAINADAVTRVAIYDDFKKQGLSELEAIMATKASMPFTRRGSWATVHALSMIIPFFNAQIQALDLIHRAFRGKMTAGDKLNAFPKMARRAALLTATTLAYVALMRDDDRYKKADPYQLYTNFMIPIPGLKEPLRMPVPYEIGYIFKAVPEAVFNLAAGDKRAAPVLDAMLQMLQNNIPGNSIIPVPQIIKPSLEALFNKEMYSGLPIETDRMKQLDPAHRFGPNTSELAKMLGGVTGQASPLSPAMIDHFINGYFGGLATQGNALVSMAAPWVIPTHAGPVEKHMNEYPIVGSGFFPETGTALVNEAYKAAQRIAEKKGTLDKLIGAGDEKAAIEYAESNKEYALAEEAAKFKKEEGEYGRLEDLVRAAMKEKMGSAEKQRLIDQIKKARSARAEAFMNTVERGRELTASK